MTVTAPGTRSGQPKQLDAGGFQPEVSSFRLHLAGEGKAARTVRTYTEAVQWFAAAYLRREGNRTCWEEVERRDVQEWVAWLLGRYSAAYASNQYRALQQFFKWLAVEEDIPDPMAGLKPPRVTDKPVSFRAVPPTAPAVQLPWPAPPRGPRRHAARSPSEKPAANLAVL
jgi:integrase